VAAIAGAGLAALDHSIGGIMYIAIPLVLVVCILLGMRPKTLQAPANAIEPTSDEKEERVLVPLLKALVRPALVTLAGFGSFIQMFGYLRDL
jgi:hypothetical protein